MGYWISDEKSIPSRVHEICSDYDPNSPLLQIRNKEEFENFKTIVAALNRLEVDYVFFDLNQEFEFSNFFPSEIPTKTENQVARISTKPPYIWTYVDMESEIPGYYACQTEVDTDKQQTVIYEGLKLIIPLVKYKEEDMQLLLASDIDGADGKKPELFDPISEEELEQVLNLIAEFDADEPFIYSQANSLGRDIGIIRASSGEYAFPIIQINLEPGSREVNVDTKLRFQVDQTETDSFCSGTAASDAVTQVTQLWTSDSSSLTSTKQVTSLARKTDTCSPDVTSEQKMKNDIISRTQQMFPGKTPEFIFNGWSTGSIICDYEIKFIEPLRTAAVSNKKE